MEVVSIVKSEKKPLNADKNLTQALPVPQSIYNNYINRNNYNTTSTRVVVVLDFILKQLTRVPEGDELFIEKQLIRHLQFFTNKYSSKVIYGLFIMRYSSFHELSVKLNLSRNKVRKSIYELEEYNIVKELKDDHYMNKVMMKYWRDTFPNTRKKPVLYIINPNFTIVVKTYQEMIFNKFITSKEYSRVIMRGKDFTKYYEKVKKQVEAVRKKEEEAIGRCSHCGNLVTNSPIRGKHYHKYHVGLICDHCKRTATKEMLIKWMDRK